MDLAVVEHADPLIEDRAGLSGDEMTVLGLSLPLCIRRLRDAIGITDAAGRTAAYVYFAGDPDSQASAKRVGPVEAEAIARVIAGAKGCAAG